MKEYMVFAFALAALVAVGGILIYDKRYATISRFVFSLILLSGFVLPLGEALGTLTGTEGLAMPEVTIPEGAYAEVVEEAYKEGIVRALAEKYGVERECIAVRLEGFDAKRMSADSVTVILTGRAALLDLRGIREYLIDGGVGEGDVRIEIG